MGAITDDYKDERKLANIKSTKRSKFQAPKSERIYKDTGPETACQGTYKS